MLLHCKVKTYSIWLRGFRGLGGTAWLFYTCNIILSAELLLVQLLTKHISQWKVPPWTSVNFCLGAKACCLTLVRMFVAVRDFTRVGWKQSIADAVPRMSSRRVARYIQTFIVLTVGRSRQRQFFHSFSRPVYKNRYLFSVTTQLVLHYKFEILFSFSFQCKNKVRWKTYLCFAPYFDLIFKFTFLKHLYWNVLS